MAFTLPNFNLSVDIYTGPWLTRVLRLSTTGNLAMGKRTAINTLSIDPIDSTTGLSPELLLPPLTDVRDVASSGANLADIVEVPAGSGRWYWVTSVDDIGKGFSNEHRCATLLKIWEGVDSTRFPGLFWPTPIP
jgi:hypothetical protein